MKPGIYENLSFEQYAAIDAVNQSKLWVMHKRTPAHYAATLEDQQDRDTTALLLGRAIHAATLEPGQFEQYYAIWNSTDSEGKKQVRRGKKWDEFREANKGLDVLTDSEHAEVLKYRNAIQRNKIFPVIRKARRELSIVWEDPGTSILCKARLDIDATDFSPFILDIKSTIDAGNDAIQKALERYGYYFQASFYLDGARALGLKAERFIFVFIEKSAPYLVRTVELNDQAIADGRTAYQDALAALLRCRQSGEYPGYPSETETIDRPEWARRQEFYNSVESNEEQFDL